MRSLFVAAYKGYAEVVRLLLAGGAQSDAIDPGGRDALWAARMNGHNEIVKLLEANRAEPGRLLQDMH
jgi:ankyrin repeat protein